jgi:hypothetical protein
MSGQVIPLKSHSHTDTVRTQRKSVRIKDQLVRDLDAPAKGNKIVYDDKISGFGVRVTAAGRKSFILNYYFKGRPLCQDSCPPLYFSSISQVGGIGR